MSWTKELTELRKVFMTLYPSGRDANRIVQDAGLEPAFIDFTGAAIDIWRNVLEWANGQGVEAIGQIIETTQNEHKHNKTLQNAVASWQAVQGGGAVSLKKPRWNPIKDMPNTNIVVLFLLSDPDNRENHTISQQLSSAKFCDQFKLETEIFVTPEGVARKLRDYMPHIVHFAGHSGDGKLYWRDEVGRSLPVPVEALGRMIGAQRKNNVQCVVLNSCFSSVEADRLLQYVPNVIATRGIIQDGIANSFATGLYQGLAGGDDLEEAFNAGLAQVQARFAGEYKKFVLL